MKWLLLTYHVVLDVVFSGTTLPGFIHSTWRQAYLFLFVKHGKSWSSPVDYQAVVLVSWLCKLLNCIVILCLIWHLELWGSLSPWQYVLLRQEVKFHELTFWENSRKVKSLLLLHQILVLSYHYNFIPISLQGLPGLREFQFTLSLSLYIAYTYIAYRYLLSTQ